ncbi:MAG TPA: hypothetical protein VGF55_07255, partial [Gemmataceae bacterium]
TTDRPPRRRRRALLLLLLVLLLLGWWLWPDGRLAKARELQNELFAEGANLTPDQRREKFQALRDVTRQMSDSQRRELGRDMMNRRQADLERYRQLSAAEKRQRLDRDINRQEEMRRRMQANANGPPRTGPGGPGGGRPTTPEDRERRRQQMLDHTTPEYRELRDQYHRDLEARRKERGLPPTPPFRGRPR